MTDTDGVGVWPNVSSWMRDESRSRSISFALRYSHLFSKKIQKPPIVRQRNYQYHRLLRADHYGRPTGGVGGVGADFSHTRFTKNLVGWVFWVCTQVSEQLAMEIHSMQSEQNEQGQAEMGLELQQ